MNSTKEQINSVNFSYNKPFLKNRLHCFSSYVNAVLLDSSLEYPHAFADGHAKVYLIEDGLSYRLVNYKLNKDVNYKCEPSADFNLVIYFYEFISDDKILFEIGDQVREHEGKLYRACIMSNSRVKQMLSLKKGTQVKGLTIQLSDKWLSNKLKDSDAKNIQLLRSTSFLMDILAAKAQKIFNELFNSHLDSAIPELYNTTRVLRLLESFLENIFKKEMSEPLLSISSKDFESILKIEGLLLENYNEVFPKIEKLARLALMSESKLKKVYKQAFGMGLYEYYQKNRMHKAKELLNSGEYTVSQVGCILGYHNLSNFSSSFKKEFNHLPKDFQMVE